MKGFRNVGSGVFCAVDDYRDKKGLAICHIVRAIDSDAPFPPEVAFQARLRIDGDYGNKEGTVFDLPADLSIPGLSATQVVLVEPDLITGGSKDLANAARRLRILGCIAQKYGS
jgi:hypothetical protein